MEEGPLWNFTVTPGGGAADLWWAQGRTPSPRVHVNSSNVQKTWSSLTDSPVKGDGCPEEESSLSEGTHSKSRVGHVH